VGEALLATLMAATMARPGPEGNRRRGFSQGFCGGYRGI
jgi:hypothetical protein